MLPAGVNVRHPDRLWIGGEWRSAASGQMLDLVDPATEQVIGTVAEAGPDDMDAAVAAARDAFDEGPWPRIGSPERLEYLKRMSAHLHARTGEIAAAWTAQMGGLASFAEPMTAGSTMGLDGIIAMAGAFGFVEQRPSMGAAVGLVVHEPVGVVAAIAPWNGPYGIMLNKVGCALAAP